MWQWFETHLNLPSVLICPSVNQGLILWIGLKMWSRATFSFVWINTATGIPTVCKWIETQLIDSSADPHFWSDKWWNLQLYVLTICTTTMHDQGGGQNVLCGMLHVPCLNNTSLFYVALCKNQWFATVDQNPLTQPLLVHSVSTNKG